MIVVGGMLAVVMYVHYKARRQLKHKLYNFKRAPKTYVDDDSFINLRE